MNLRGALTFLVFLIATPICGLLATVLGLLGWRESTMWFGKIWSRSILWATGARLQILGHERLSTDGPTIFLANHLSNVDVWVLMVLLPLSTRFVAKQSLFRIPFLGWAMRASGFVAVDRENRSRAIESLDRAAEQIRSGAGVILFPEGTRSRDGRLQPFKKGPFHLAARAAVPVQAIVIQGSADVMPPRSLRVQPGVVTATILEPIAADEFAGRRPGVLRGRMEQTFREVLGEPLPDDPSADASAGSA